MEKREAPVKPAEISEQEWQVVQLMRKVEYGELLVSIKGGKPVRVEEIRKSIQIK